MTARERFKALLANSLERVCVLEEQLEQAHAKVADLEAQLAERNGRPIEYATLGRQNDG